jgi:hypothetical protein
MMTHRVLCLHSLRTRWADDCLRAGLQRPSSSWFAIGSATVDQLRVTVAAAAYLALGRDRPAALAADCTASYATYFDWAPEDRPSFVWFWSAPIPGPARKYRWLHVPDLAATAPYTKVQLAGPPMMHAPVVTNATAADVEHAEHAANFWRRRSSGNGWYEARRPISLLDQEPCFTAYTKLGAFCWELGIRLWEKFNDSDDQ